MYSSQLMAFFNVDTFQLCSNASVAAPRIALQGNYPTLEIECRTPIAHVQLHPSYRRMRDGAYGDSERMGRMGRMANVPITSSPATAAAAAMTTMLEPALVAYSPSTASSSPPDPDFA